MKVWAVNKGLGIVHVWAFGFGVLLNGYLELGFRVNVSMRESEGLDSGPWIYLKVMPRKLGQ